MTAYVHTRAGRFAYLQRGDARGRPVLCLHGFPDHPPSFVPFMEELAAAGYRAVAPWMRGYAPSMLEGPYHTDQLGADAVALAEALFDDAPCAIVGHDWGAVATYAAISTAPERWTSAVTMAVPHPLAFLRALRLQPAQLRRSWYMGLFQLPLVPERVVPRDDFALVRRLWRAWSPDFELSPTEHAALAACLSASMPAPIAYYRAMTRPLGEVARRMRRVAGERITVRTLHLQGERDGCIAPEACAGQERFFAAEFRTEVVPGVGHFLQLEAPAAVAARVRAWLEARARAAPTP
jgi:pimeloyl-ACP methyl ester carboxylesterase